MSLFSKGFFRLHSGRVSNLKVDCDSLTDEDYDALAYLIAKHFQFAYVDYIAEGGRNLAKALEPYRQDRSIYSLLVGDVLTTGNSMKNRRKELEKEAHCIVEGVVIFARGKCPNWITPIWRLDKKFWKE